ncbi:hypothetical protein [Shewanella pneumatophori]|uniref:Uncharacterized protein n=1 Tax=Shewanella pneumatophori TaxID=314092 RepID=A0A9X1ZDY6_9GAMM|nr:hypothetical protein [Shewanella pneumatophori]MCL1138067.1 hypothetical protein [Shewanella pneumatophori]
MEFLLFCLIFIACFLVAFKPHKQKLAHIFLALSILMSMGIWLIATWGMLVPAGNL